MIAAGLPGLLEVEVATDEVDPAWGMRGGVGVRRGHEDRMLQISRRVPKRGVLVVLRTWLGNQQAHPSS